MIVHFAVFGMKYKPKTCWIQHTKHCVVVAAHEEDKEDINKQTLRRTLDSSQEHKPHYT